MRTSVVVAVLLSLQIAGGAQALVGVQEPAWAPDGKRIAVSYLDRIWTMTAEGRQGKAVTTGDGSAIEREPAWAPDGNRLAYAADRGDGFDIFVVSLKNGVAAATPVAVTTLPGDERWPSWTADGRLVFAHRDARASGRAADPSLQWDLFVVRAVQGSDAWQAPQALTETADSETYPRVSPDGSKVAFISERDSEDDLDLWWMPVPPPAVAKPTPLGSRPAKPVTAFVPSVGTDGGPLRANRIARVRGNEAYPSWAPDNVRVAFYAVREGIGSVWVTAVEPPRPEGTEELQPRPKPAAQPQLVSRKGGAPAWSPDGKTLLVSGLPDPQPVYNGNPLRNEVEAPPLFALNAAFQLWRVAAPLPVHEEGGLVTAEIAPSPTTFTAMFDRVWNTLRALYYSAPPAAEKWTTLRDQFRPRATSAKSASNLESVIDEMVAAQPLIKPVITANGAVVVSGHPLASEAGRLALEKGGDGSAVLYLKGMKKPTVTEYKDMTPMRAPADNPALMQDGRIIADGLEAAKIYLPGGKVPKPGDRFFNKDYANTLRAIQKGGADAFYRGEIAKKIAADMEENGGILTFADMAQYRAIERTPVMGRYRGHTLYAGGPPVAGARASTDPDYLHYLVESWKVRDPLRRVADPERWPVEFEEHLTAEHLGRHVLRVEGPRLSLQQPPAIEPANGGRLRQPRPVDALEHRQRADAGVRAEGQRRRSAAPGGGPRWQRVDPGVGLQHHHWRDRRQARCAGRH